MSMVAAAKTRGIAHRIERREEIVAHAAEMFAELGYDRVSLNAVAQRMRITKPGLYYYFKSKDDILLEIKRRAQEEIFLVIDEAAASSGTGLEKLERLIAGYIRVMASNAGRCLITVKRSALDRGGRKRIQGRDKDAENRILEIFQSGMDDGSIKRQDLRIAYQAIFGMLSWIAVWYKDHGPVGRDQMIAQVVRLLLDGVRGASR